jgi:hypothetical protein
MLDIAKRKRSYSTYVSFVGKNSLTFIYVNPKKLVVLRELRIFYEPK